MARDLSLGEIFVELSKKTKSAEKTAWLRQHAERRVFYLLQLALLPQVKWALPEGEPPFKRREGRNGRPGTAPTDITHELRWFYLFLDGQEPGMRQLQREQRFTSMLRDLEPEEVDLVIAIKDKTFAKKYGCTKKLIDETFPGLLTSHFDGKYLRP